ncbi:MAG: winged helix-turn-helix domain-containing protein [Bryobacterales bacterium]|nr:winged helix-turn-helix domain-containing protein [Bryobacterales bacterium]
MNPRTSFGVYRIDTTTGEVWRGERRVGLQQKPYQVLLALLKRPGEVVSRDELRRALWPLASYGEFDDGVNTAIKKLRRALGDSAGSPRFIETLPRKGYRFIAPLQETRGKTIAVLPFANTSGVANDEVFADGLAEDIINALARIPGLKVMARTTVFALKGRREDVRKLGADLGVEHVLEGGVRRAGSRVRVNVQLVSVPDGWQLWSQRYEGELSDTFQMQDDISRAVTEEVRTRIGHADYGRNERNA